MNPLSAVSKRFLALVAEADRKANTAYSLGAQSSRNIYFPDYQECSAARSTRRGCGFVEHAAFTRRVRMVRRLKRRLNRYCT